MRRVSGVVLGGYAGDVWEMMPEEWESVKNLRGGFAFRAFLLYLCSSGGSTGVPLFLCPGGWGGCRAGRTAGQKGCSGWMKGPLSPDERGLFAG